MPIPHHPQANAATASQRKQLVIGSGSASHRPHWLLRWDSVLVAIAVLWTLWFALGSPRLWDRDEPRNARCAVEMLARQDWIVPMFNDELRTHKPILLYWLQITSYSLFGVSEFAARCGSAACGTLSVLALFLFGRYHVSSHFGKWAAVVLTSCMMFVVAARAATPDATLIATTTLGILLLAHGRMIARSGHRGGLTSSNATFLGYVALGCAVLAKGPVGVVIPLTVIGCWHFLQNLQMQATGGNPIPTERQAWWKTCVTLLRQPDSWFQWLASSFRNIVTVAWRSAAELQLVRGLAMVLLVSLPWYIWVGVRTDGQWLYGFFIEHNVQRAVTSMEGHSGGLWYYPMAMLFGVFPWSLMLIPIVLWTASQLRHQANSAWVQLCVLWILTTLAAFTCAGTKLPSYITTCYPGAAMLIAGFFFDWQQQKAKLGNRLDQVAAAVMVFFGLGLSLAIAWASFYYAMPKLAWCAMAPLGLLWPALATYPGTAKGLQDRVSSSWWTKQFSLPAVRFAAAGVLLVGTCLGVAPAIVSQYRSDLDQLIAAAQADRASANDAAIQWLAVGTLDPSWVYYMEHPIREVSRNSPNASSSESWLRVAIEHLQKPNSRLILSSEDATLVRELWSTQSGNSSAKTSLIPMLQFRRFLTQEELVVLRAVPSDASTRVANLPRATVNSQSSEQLKR